MNGWKARKWRIALYSHDAVGLGHMRRNMLIAETIMSSSIPASILLVGGAREACAFKLPRGVDWLTLPSFQKNAGGEYQARSLDVELEELVSLRSRLIATALEAFSPDVFIVDKRPRGALRELDAALQNLRAAGRTRCVLGLRDVLDDPARVQQEWCDDDDEAAVHDFYDAVWVYGDRSVYDQVKEYGYPAHIAAKLRYTGYLIRGGHVNDSDEMPPEPVQQCIGPDDRVVLCTVGGGQDGGQLAEAFAQISFPAGVKGVLLTGPLMPADLQTRLRRLAAGNSRLRVIQFLSDVDWLIHRSSAIVAMGGYNTVWEAVYRGKYLLIVPRVQPRQEQLIRAQRLERLGFVDVLCPDRVTPGALCAWIERGMGSATATSTRLDFTGSRNLLHFLSEILLTPLSEAREAKPRSFDRRHHHAVR
jgi:predicted glycosyltransferase